MKVEGQTIVLRTLNFNDVADLINVTNDDDVKLYLELPFPFLEKEAKNFIQNVNTSKVVPFV